MNTTEVTIMLTFISSIDGRLQPDEGTVLAWMQVLASDMEAKWASQHIKNHYGKTGDMLIPSNLNRAWHMYKQTRMLTAPDIESHCGRSGCPCTHRMCYRGWIDQPIREIQDESVKRDIKLLRDNGGGISEAMQLMRGRVKWDHRLEEKYPTTRKCEICRPALEPA